MSDLEETYQAPLTAPDPFAFAREAHIQLKTCCNGTSRVDQIEYLWIYAREHGLGKCPPPPGASLPDLEHWLNVVDEAASLGARWLVVSVEETTLDAIPELLPICKWAQDAHDMSVVIHTNAKSIDEAELAALKQLDQALLRLFVTQENHSAFAHLEADGIRVRIGQPDRVGEHGCGMPKSMVFVNGMGELYTCGMVEGDERFRMGNIYERKFGEVLCDPALPHAVPPEARHKSHGCDGCPPLLANRLKDA